MSKAEQFMNEMNRLTQVGQARGVLAPRQPYRPNTTLYDRQPGKLWDDFLMGVQLLNAVANRLGTNRETVRAAGVMKQRLNEFMNIYDQHANKEPENFSGPPVFRR